jgi:hypothetical protein
VDIDAMAAASASIEDRVSVFIEDILKVEDIREAFNVFLVHSHDKTRAGISPIL